MHRLCINRPQKHRHLKTQFNKHTCIFSLVQRQVDCSFRVNATTYRLGIGNGGIRSPRLAILSLLVTVPFVFIKEILFFSFLLSGLPPSHTSVYLKRALRNGNPGEISSHSQEKIELKCCLANVALSNVVSDCRMQATRLSRPFIRFARVMETRL